MKTYEHKNTQKTKQPPQQKTTLTQMFRAACFYSQHKLETPQMSSYGGTVKPTMEHPYDEMKSLSNKNERTVYT